MEDKIHRFEIMTSILTTFVRCTSKWQVEDKDVRARFEQIHDVVNQVLEDVEIHGFLTLASGNEGRTLSARNEKLVASSLNKMELIKGDMREVYSMVAVASYRKMDVFGYLKIFPRSTKLFSGYLSAYFPLNFDLSKALNMVSFLESLLGNLKDILSCMANLISPVKTEIEALQDDLTFFKTFTWFVINRCINLRKLKDLLTYTESVAINVACVLYFCLVDENMVGEMKNELVVLVEKIKPFQPEAREIYRGASINLRSPHDDTPEMDDHFLAFVDSLIGNLRKLFDSKDNFLFDAEDQTDIFLEELKLLRFNLMEPLLDVYSKKTRALMVHIKAVINKIAHFLYFFCASEMKAGMAGQLDHALPGIAEEIDSIKREATDLYHELVPKSWRSNFPRTNELGFIDFLMKNLKEQLQLDEASLNPFKRQIEVVRDELELLRKDLTDYSEQLKRKGGKDLTENSEQLMQKEEFNIVLAHFKDSTYHAEYIVDSFIARAGSPWRHKLGLFEVRKEIRLIHKELKAVSKTTTTDTPSILLSQANPTNIDALPGLGNEIGNMTEEETIELVSHQVAAEKIIDQLTRGADELKILSISGMPGIGKTTLANSLYKDHSVTFHFHVQAWGCVSRTYQKKTLFLDILGQITEETHKNCEVEDSDLVEKLYKSLKGKRYLIVLDDIWDIEAWNDLKEVFPNDYYGSRILFTTRNRGVALEANSVPYALSTLSEDESWDLLQAKVFEGKTCPLELFQIGKRIAKKCEGLPLAVVSIAGILKTMERKEDLWEKVEKSLWSEEVNNPLGQHFGILELCYNHLPNWLKPCFLYFGSFPEDAVIPVAKLFWLWIAEGFVHRENPRYNSLEIEAENYLKDLIDRSLVTVALRSSKNGVKSCRVHDLLRDFCLAKAKEENFLLHLNKYDEISAASTDSIMHQQYRLCIHSDKKHDVTPGHLRAHSLLFTSKLYKSSGELHLIDFMLKFKLLRVLDLRHIANNDGICVTDAIQICELVHLRFLAIPACHGTVIPSEIVNLKNLETLIIVALNEGIVLPETIWKLARLRHLCVKNGYFSLERIGWDFLCNLSSMDNLITLSAVKFCIGKYMEKLPRMLFGLQKLACIVDIADDNPVVELYQIETLKITYQGQFRHPIRLKFATHLKKLTLSNYRGLWPRISVIGRLPNLEILKLEDRAFMGRQWDMNEGEFQKLKFLKLSYLNLVVWNASSEHFPCLERLVMQRCASLEVIPLALGEVSTLLSIEMKQCNSCVVPILREIMNEQRDMGNDEFDLQVIAPIGPIA